ncbi:MAG: UDP-N-acetylglucosamine 1-carboxyvinyltransferase [Patescibacteria group bacterium]|jgi:UDP-N-acetylglucosamine 1-carboxyvinyltransferase
MHNPHYRIRGGSPVNGDVQIAGGKNTIDALIPATLLTGEECVLENVPDNGEAAIASELASAVGAMVQRQSHVVTVNAATIQTNTITELSRRNRLPILALAPLVHRTGEAHVPRVGGDKIGARPVDFHIDALRTFGATVTEDEQGYHARATRLRGADITLPFPSVGATETILLAAVLAEGNTIVRNAANEPEIAELIRLLQNMGAIIGLEPGTIHITGVDELHGAHHRLIPDRLEAASYAALALATGGDVYLRGARQEHLTSYLAFIRSVGGDFRVDDEGIRVWRTGPLHATALTTQVFPGFVTDWQQPSAVVLTQAEGRSTIHETIYEDRFGYTDDLVRMGAQITVQDDCGDQACRYAGQGAWHLAVIEGPAPLTATTLDVPDIRAGMAHVIAALVAEGESTLQGIHHLDRGYEYLEEKLRGIGATMTREEA